jgi:hypothetical protein
VILVAITDIRRLAPTNNYLAMHRCAGDGIIVSGVAVNQPIIVECPRAKRHMTKRGQDLVSTSDLKLGTRSLMFDDLEVIQLLRTAIAREGNQDAFVRRHSVGRSYLNQILNGRKPINEAVLKALGLRKVRSPDND